MVTQPHLQIIKTSLQVPAFIWKRFIKIYDLRKYYPDFIGANPVAVVSDLTEEELLLQCPELRSQAPFVMFTTAQWREAFSAIRAYDLNEKKHQMQAIRHEAAFEYRDGATELYMRDIDEYDVMDEALNRIALEQLRAEMGRLPEGQRRRLQKHYSGFTYQEIADDENVSKI